MREFRLVVCAFAHAAALPATAAERFFVYNLSTNTEFTGMWLAPAV